MEKKAFIFLSIFICLFIYFLTGIGFILYYISKPIVMIHF